MKNKNRRMLITTVAILLLLVIVTAVSGGGDVIKSMLGFVTTPMQKISATTTENTTEFLNLDAMTKDELKERNQELAQENRELREKFVDYEDMKKENEQLKNQLKVTEERPELDYVSASVILRDPNDSFYGFYIDKGYLAGVTKDAPVITNDGLIGIVTEVYATTSTVTCILSEEVKVSAISKEFDEPGVITSDVIMASNGTLKMIFLPHDTKLEEGTIITTSGAGATFPADLVIGYVTSVELSETVVSSTAVVKPYADLKNARDVFVITGFPGKDEEVPEADYEGDTTGNEDPETEESE